MNLPQEVLDEIFSHLDPYYDGVSLRACSLVARSWVYPAQRRFFSSVTITPAVEQSWNDNISPTNIKLLSHVRSLDYGKWSHQRFPSRVGALVDYFPSLRQLRSLTLTRMWIGLGFSEHVEVFSAFQHTLSSLYLRDIYLPWTALIILINYFPFLKNLEVQNPSFGERDDHPTPLSRPLHGRLAITKFAEPALKTLSDRLPALGGQLACDELAIWGRLINHLVCLDHYQCVIDTCGKNLKRLSLSLRKCAAL